MSQSATIKHEQTKNKKFDLGYFSVLPFTPNLRFKSIMSSQDIKLP